MIKNYLENNGLIIFFHVDRAEFHNGLIIYRYYRSYVFNLNLEIVLAVQMSSLLSSTCHFEMDTT